MEISKSERKRINVQQGKPMMEGVTDPIPPKPEGLWHEYNHDHESSCKFCTIGGEDSAFWAEKRNEAYVLGIAQGVAQERAKWEKLKEHCINGIKNSGGHEYENVLDKMTELEG